MVILLICKTPIAQNSMQWPNKNIIKQGNKELRVITLVCQWRTGQHQWIIPHIKYDQAFFKYFSAERQQEVCAR